MNKVLGRDIKTKEEVICGYKDVSVKDLIAFLNGLDKDLRVVVQYRDDGGDYYGEDETILLDIKDGKLYL